MFLLADDAPPVVIVEQLVVRLRGRVEPLKELEAGDAIEQRPPLAAVANRRRRPTVSVHTASLVLLC